MKLEEVIAQELKKYVDNNLQEAVSEKVSGLMDDILGDMFRSYSDHGKAIKEIISSKINVNLDKFDLVDYNVFIADAVNKRLVQCINDNNVDPIIEMVDGIVGKVKDDTVRLSDIVERFKDSSREDNDQEGEGEISLHIEDEDDWFSIAIDAEADNDERSCGIKFLISKSRGTIFSFSAGSYNASQKEITPARLTMLDVLEKEIFRLYAAGVKIKVDCGEDDKYWSRY